MIWQHGEDELNRFLGKLSNFYPPIKFTCEYSFEEFNYLGQHAFLKEGNLITDLHIKQTDSHQDLELLSCHSYHCTKSIRYSQELSMNRICSENVPYDL